MIGYHFIDIEIEDVAYLKSTREIGQFDIFSFKILGIDEKLYIKVDYDMSCSNEEIFECYIVTLEDVRVRNWIRKED